GSVRIVRHWSSVPDDATLRGGVVDRGTTPFYYTISFQSLFLSSFVVVWSASHILEDWKGRITWPSITLGVGVANLSTVLIAYYVQITPVPISSTTPSSLPAILALISGPILSIIGGILASRPCCNTRENTATQ